MLPVIAVLAAAVLFGTTGTAQALGPDGATPLSIGAVRLVIGGTVLAAVAAVRARRAAAPGPRLTRGAFGLMAATAACLAAYQPLFFLGTERNGVAVGTVVALGTAPVLAGVAEWALRARRPSAVWLLATVTATAGVVLLGAGGQDDASAGTDPVGLLGSVGAGAAFAAIAVAQRRLLAAGWDPFTVIGAMGAGSAVLALVVLPWAGTAWLAQPRGIAMAVWLGLATIVVAYSLFTWGLGALSAATAATLTLAEPLTATLLGVLILGEQLSPVAIAGLVVLAAGLVMLAAGSRRQVPFAVEG